MKNLAFLFFALCFFVISAAPVEAQEHYTEGPVWVISYFRAKPGMFDEYMKYLRREFTRSAARQKEEHIILDAKVLLNPTVEGPEDWDVAIAYLYSDYGKALNFNASDSDKLEKIGEEITGQKDKEKRAAMHNATRLSLRDFLRMRVVREVTLKPIR